MPTGLWKGRVLLCLWVQYLAWPAAGIETAGVPPLMPSAACGVRWPACGRRWQMPAPLPHSQLALPAAVVASGPRSCCGSCPWGSSTRGSCVNVCASPQPRMPPRTRCATARRCTGALTAPGWRAALTMGWHASGPEQVCLIELHDSHKHKWQTILHSISLLSACSCCSGCQLGQEAGA